MRCFRVLGVKNKQPTHSQTFSSTLFIILVFPMFALTHNFGRISSFASPPCSCAPVPLLPDDTGALRLFHPLLPTSVGNEAEMMLCKVSLKGQESREAHCGDCWHRGGVLRGMETGYWVRLPWEAYLGFPGPKLGQWCLL